MTSMRRCAVATVAVLAVLLTGAACAGPEPTYPDALLVDVPLASPPAVHTTLDWETTLQQSVPGTPPPGWSGEYAPELVHRNSGQPQVRIARAPEPVRAGAAAVRFELQRGDPVINYATRAELATPLEPQGAERWYAFSVYLPADWALDRSQETVALWHQHHTMAGNPPLAIATNHGRWEIQTAWDSHVDAASAGDYRTGRWTDWLIHTKWSPDGDGILQIWKDGRPVKGYADRRGPNTYRSQYGMYLKVGLYKWDWSLHKPTDTTRRVMYLDEVRIGQSRAGVAPPDPPKPGGYPADGPSS